MNFPETIFEVTDSGHVQRLDYSGPFAQNPRFAMYRAAGSFQKAVPARAIAGMNGKDKGDFYADHDTAVRAAIAELEKRLRLLRARIEE